jgi:hypothetical protein
MEWSDRINCPTGRVSPPGPPMATRSSPSWNWVIRYGRSRVCSTKSRTSSGPITSQRCTEDCDHSIIAVASITVSGDRMIKARVNLGVRLKPKSVGPPE